MKAACMAVTGLVPVILSPAWGHHSEAGFDTDAVVAFQGTVIEFNWRNPHVYIDVESADAAGNVVQWVVETGATPIMRRSDWTPESLQAGDVISVRGHPERGTGRNYTLLLSLEKADGSTLAQYSGDPTSSASATSLAGVWKGRSATVGEFFDGLRDVPLTDAGSAAKAAYDFYDDSPAAAWPIRTTIIEVGEIRRLTLDRNQPLAAALIDTRQ